jgi:hypothetical protein
MNRSILNRSLLNQALKAKADCLTPQELEKLAADASASHPHLSECAHCEGELAMLKMFESSEPLPGEGAAVAWISARLEKSLDQIKNPGRARKAANTNVSWISRLLGGGNMRWLLPVTAVLVVALTSAVLMRRSQEPQLNANAGQGPAVYRSQEVATIGPSGELPEAPKTLQWKAFPGASGYKIEIMEIDENPLWSSETQGQILTIPAAIRAKMLPGKPVLWKVTALDGQEHVLAVSQVQRLSVQRKSPSSNSGVLPR